MITYGILVTTKADKDEQLVYEYITKTFGEIYKVTEKEVVIIRILNSKTQKSSGY